MSSFSTTEKGYNPKRTAVQVSGLSLAALSFQTLGIIYSDIGTSPLYVLNGIWPTTGEMPPEEDIVGGISAILWALLLLPLLKYTLVSLYFGTKEGEGGSFALYQGIYPPREIDFDDERTLTGASIQHAGKSGTSTTTKKSLKQRLRWPLLVWCLFATALTMADGVLTPAVSVTSAVGGIATAKPSVINSIVPISIAFLLALFFAQQFGTARLAVAFAPISFLWFLLLTGTGIYNITYHPAIFRAFDPSRAVMLFVRTKNYDLLAGVLLAVTGSEAMFANLGQFNASSIRISFGLFVYPALTLAYLGQGARLIVDKEQILSSIFYNSIPGPIGGPLYWIMFIFAVLATLIASQAMITATFSLIQQVINSKCFPPIRMHYTSDTIQGQVYIPAVNWTLMIATIVLVAALTNLANLTNAYGFAVATVMFSTTVMLAIQTKYVKRWPVVVGVLLFVFFGFFDALFWGASFRKVPEGAWIPLMFGCIILAVMVHWTWARGLEDAFDGKNRMNLRHFIGREQRKSPNEDDDDLNAGVDLEPLYYMQSRAGSTEKLDDEGVVNAKRELQRIPSFAVFHKITSGRGVPHTFVGFIRQWPALPRVVIFLSVALVPVARVPLDKRYAVTKVRTVEGKLLPPSLSTIDSDESTLTSGFYGVTYYIAFRDKFDVQISAMVDEICEIERQSNPDVSSAVLEEIRAIAQTATHIVPHYHVVSRRTNSGMLSPITNYIRAFFIESIYRRLATMFPETANWLTSADEIIHVGINAVI